MALCRAFLYLKLFAHIFGCHKIFRPKVSDIETIKVEYARRLTLDYYPGLTNFDEPVFTLKFSTCFRFLDLFKGGPSNRKMKKNTLSEVSGTVANDNDQ